jgi:hypothetical protein
LTSSVRTSWTIPAVLVLSFGSLALLAQPAAAKPAPKVAICHHTSSATNPFVLINVSSNAIPAHEQHGDTIPAPAQGCGDVCPNIPGAQPAVPAGMVIDPAGNCVPAPQPCNEQTNSGGEGTTVNTYEMGAFSGTFVFDYETYTIPDDITIRYAGNVIFSTGGPVSTNGLGATASVSFGPGIFTTVEVTVVGPSGTAWDYTVHCPSPPV